MSPEASSGLMNPYPLVALNSLTVPRCNSLPVMTDFRDLDCTDVLDSDASADLNNIPTVSCVMVSQVLNATSC
jgi:hypothetical protein